MIKRISAIIAACAVTVLMTPFGFSGTGQGGAVYADDNTMNTLTYNIDVEVSEDNSYDYHEHLDMYYVTPHHGIYRYIPTQGQKLSRIRVPGYDYEDYSSGSYRVVKIGSGSYALVGENDYDIYYHIAMYDDENEEKDMLLLNLIPTDWETGIEKSTCTVTLPKEADLSKANVYSGSYGTAGNEDNAVLETSDDGRTITITAENLPAHHGITLELELPEGYWQGAPVFGRLTVLNMLLFALGPVGAAVLWYLYGRDKHMVKTLEFYPPDGLTPGEIGYLADGRVDKQDVISTIVYLADKGYIEIEELENSRRKNFRFIALKAPGGSEPQYVRTIYNGLFPDGRTETLSTSLGTSFGRKYQTASEQLKRLFEGKNTIIRPESQMARAGCAVASIMPTIAFITWGSVNGDDSGMFNIIWSGAHILAAVALLCSIYDNIRVRERVSIVVKGLGAIWCFMMGVGITPLASDAFELLSDSKQIAVTAYLVIGTLLCMFFSVVAIAKTDKYTELLGRTLGFKDFIKTAELDKLNELVEDDPQYFYHIMPYAYVFGLSNKWIKNFENIPVITPEWYRSSRRFDSFDYYMMGRMMSDCSASVSNNIVIPAPSGGSHGGFSGGSRGGGFPGGGSSWSGGGGFSGGGFSGGGAGGGGGGGW